MSYIASFPSTLFNSSKYYIVTTTIKLYNLEI